MNRKIESLTIGAPALTTEQLAQKALAATVYLEMKNSTGTTLSFGSGFFVTPNQIATNFHVIEGAAQGTAKLVDEDTRYQIKDIVATDKDTDLALLKVTADGVTPLPLGDSDTVNIGAKVYVAGNPKGLEGTFSDGLISRRERYPKKRLQMTAPISPGSSGGPVLNSKGEVIGISVSVHRALDAQNLNFAIPSNYLKALLAKGQPARPLSQSSQSISAETYWHRGNAKYELGQYEAAISDYTEAIRLKSDDAFAYNNRGNAKYRLKQYLAAIADYTEAIRLKYNYAGAYNNRGIAKVELDQYFPAIADFDMAIRLKLNYADAYNNRGIAKVELGQYFPAIADFDTVIRRKPDYALAYCQRGLVKALLDRTWEAREDVRTALRLVEKAGDESLKAHIEGALRLLE